MIVVMNGSPAEKVARLSEELGSNWRLMPEKIVGKHKVVLNLVNNTAELDPLHGTGTACVLSMAMPAIPARADSLIIQVHPNPAT